MESREPNPEQRSKARETGARLGRSAARLFRTGGPRVKRALEENRPRAEQAGREAVRYAQDHQDEIKSLAIRGAKMRLGPLGMALDALGLGGRPAAGQSPQEAQSAPQERRCEACQASITPDAKFCNQCGARLQTDA